MRFWIPTLLIIFASVIVYGLTVRGVVGNPTPQQINAELTAAGQPFESSLARGRFAQTMAIVEDGTFDLTNGKEYIATPDVGLYDGRFYSLFPPGISLMAAPAYIVGSYFGYSQVAVYIFFSLILIIDSLLIFAIAQRLGTQSWTAAFAALTFALTTTAWPYAVTAIVQHNVSVLFLLTIILAGLYGKKYWGLYWLGWLAYGMSLLVDYPNGLMLLPAVVYMSFSALDIKMTPKKTSHLTFRLAIVYAFTAFVAIGAFHAYYNAVNFGSPQTIGTSVFTRMNSATDIEAAKNSASQTDNSDQTTVEDVEPNRSSVVGIFDARRLDRGLNVLLISLGRGIIIFAPLVVLGIFGIWQANQRATGLGMVLIGTIVINLTLYGSFGDPWGGWVYGPRYLIISMSMLAIGLALFIQKYHRWWIKPIYAALFMYGFVVQSFGTLTTSQLPADVEAIPAGLPYTYAWNIELFADGMNSSFVYQEYLNTYFNQWQYLGLLITIGAITGISALYLLPTVEKLSHEI